MNNVKYITDCPGEMCFLDKKDLIRRSDKDGKSKHFCIKHGGVLIQKRGICEDCGKEFYMTVKGCNKKYCDKCTKRKRAIYMKEYSKKTYAKSIGDKSAHVKFSVHRRGDYCSEVSACYRVASKNSKGLACDGCKAFTEIMPGVDPERMGYYR